MNNLDKLYLLEQQSVVDVPSLQSRSHSILLNQSISSSMFLSYFHYFNSQCNKLLTYPNFLGLELEILLFNFIPTK